LIRPEWLPDSEYPFAIRELAIGGHRIRYVDEGSGPTLLFVHAGPAWSFVYRDLIVRLRDSFRCVALDFPGVGLSLAAAGYQPSLERAADVCEEFLLALDLREITLVTHDVGTPVALGAAIKMPERFAAIAVTEGFAWALADENPGIARMLRIVSSRPVGLLNGALNLLARVTASAAGSGRNLTARGRRAFLGPYRERIVRRNAAATLGAAVRDSDFLRRLDSALAATFRDRPLLLVFGSSSPTVRDGFPERWMRNFPDARLVTVEGGHHFPMNDAPDFVAATIRSWWNQAVVATPRPSPARSDMKNNRHGGSSNGHPNFDRP